MHVLSIIALLQHVYKDSFPSANLHIVSIILPPLYILNRPLVLRSPAWRHLLVGNCHRVLPVSVPLYITRRCDTASISLNATSLCFS